MGGSVIYVNQRQVYSHAQHIYRHTVYSDMYTHMHSIYIGILYTRMHSIYIGILYTRMHSIYIGLLYAAKKIKVRFTWVVFISGTYAVLLAHYLLYYVACIMFYKRHSLHLGITNFYFGDCSVNNFQHQIVLSRVACLVFTCLLTRVNARLTH